MKIGFLHTDLGLGGAERLVVNAAVELEARGHRVTIFTPRLDAAQAFPETRNLDVRVRGAFLPARVAGRFQAMCTVARLSWVAAAMAGERFDAVMCDLVPHPIPILKALGRTAVVYYCHFPDRLLAAPRRGFYRLYRAPLDGLEIPTMRAADRVLANSRYTARALAEMGCRADVVYPGIELTRYQALPPPPSDDHELLVISRFEPQKNLTLAIEALARLRVVAPALFARTRLRFAGAFETARPEARATVRELEALAQARGLGDRVTLQGSPGDDELVALLGRASCLVHPMIDEHFGLVPVEAMAAGRPVVAVAGGGPLETVVDGRTGYLCAPTPDAFAHALVRVLGEPGAAARLGQAGRERAVTHFSRAILGDALEAVFTGVCAG